MTVNDYTRIELIPFPEIPLRIRSALYKTIRHISKLKEGEVLTKKVALRNLDKLESSKDRELNLVRRQPWMTILNFKIQRKGCGIDWGKHQVV